MFLPERNRNDLGGFSPKPLKILPMRQLTLKPKVQHYFSKLPIRQSESTQHYCQAQNATLLDFYFMINYSYGRSDDAYTVIVGGVTLGASGGGIHSPGIWLMVWMDHSQILLCSLLIGKFS